MATRLPTYAFGKRFTHIPEHVRQDLGTLERESAVYTDHWIDEIGDFRHVRIEFTDDERQEFARRSWAYELFIRANAPYWAAETPGIDPDIATEADSHSLHLRDGTVIPPPYHSFAAFLGEHLWALVCTNTDRIQVIELAGKEAALFDVGRTIDALTATIRSFNNREKGLNPWPISCEDDVRDLLHVMLRSRVFDINKEVVVPSKAGRHKFADLASEGLRLFIEVKWINSTARERRVMSEIHDDIQTYCIHPTCDHLWFLIVDNVRAIRDPQQFEDQLTGLQIINGRQIDIRLMVRDT